MIDDVSRALKDILTDPAIKGACEELCEVDIKFDRPSEQFKAEKSTVDLFLYDVRENMELRSTEPVIDRRGDTAIVRRPPLRISCSYLVTAWDPGAGDNALLNEHRLLSQALQVLSRYPTIPREFFPKDSPLRSQEPPLPMMITQMNGVKDPADFWSAIGGKMRPSIVVTVTVSLPVFDPRELAGEPLVTSRVMTIGERTSPDERGISPETKSSTEMKDLFKVFGTVTGPDNGPVKDAVVAIPELGLRASTEVNGRYDLGLVPRGRYTFHVEPVWKGSKLKPKEVCYEVSASAEINVLLDK